MGLKDLLDRIKLSFCCKSKCSINEVDDRLNDANEWIDDIQDDIQDVVSAVQQSPLVRTQSPKQYNYYSKKKSAL